MALWNIMATEKMVAISDLIHLWVNPEPWFKTGSLSFFKLGGYDNTMEHDRTPANKYEYTIKEMFVNKISKDDFCRDLLALSVDDEFDSFVNSNVKIAELFDLCVKYLDRDVRNKKGVWARIESNIESYSRQP